MAHDFVAPMIAALRSAGFTEATVERHGGLAPRWMAHGYNSAGRWVHVTFHGQRDWRSALDMMGALTP